jgi:hypothetical protein
MANSVSHRSWVRRFFHRLFAPRLPGRLLALALTLATLVVLFYVEEKVRGRWAWNRYRQTLEKQGLSVDIKTITPPALPPDANFARSPALKALYDYVSRQKRPAAGEWDKLDAALGEPQKLGAKLGYSFAQGMGGNWRKSAWPDPYKMLGEPAKKGFKAEPPASPEKAAELVLDIYRKTTGPLLDELQVEARKRRCSNFDINYDTDEPFSILLPYLANFKALGQQSAARAAAELYLKQPEPAFHDTLFCLHMSETIKDDPFLISHLVSVALREIGINAVWYGLATRQWNAAQLEQLQARFEEVDMMSRARRALNAERVLGQRGIEGFAREFPHKANFTTLGGAVEWSELDEEPRSVESALLEECLSYLYPKGWFYFESINYQRLFVNHLLASSPAGQTRLDLTALDTASEKMGEELKGPPIASIFKHRYLSGMLLPALGKVYFKAANNQMASTMAATACALERFRIDHGKYPPQLADLTPRYLKQPPLDLMSGEPLKYRVDAEGTYIMYSVGRNGVDDGGKVVLSKSGNVTHQEGDWVWKYPAGR